MYQLTLETSASASASTLWKDGRFVATARGAWVKSGVKFEENTVLLRVNPRSCSRSLIEVRLARLGEIDRAEDSR